MECSLKTCNQRVEDEGWHWQVCIQCLYHTFCKSIGYYWWRALEQQCLGLNQMSVSSFVKNKLGETIRRSKETPLHLFLKKKKKKLGSACKCLMSSFSLSPTLGNREHYVVRLFRTHFLWSLVHETVCSQKHQHKRLTIIDALWICLKAHSQFTT